MNEHGHDRPRWRGFQVGLAAALMAISAVCFLKYVWWAACYSGWYGLPSYAQQLRIAAARASFYLWSVIALQTATLAVVWGLIRLRYTDPSQFLKYGARLAASAAITITGTALLVCFLSWFRFFHIR
jgi:hypothetical protein